MPYNQIIIRSKQKILFNQKNRSFGKRVQNGVTSKEDALGNGVAHSLQPSMSQNKMGRSRTEGSEKAIPVYVPLLKLSMLPDSLLSNTKMDWRLCCGVLSSNCW